MESFEDVWRYLRVNLKKGTEIKNWTILKGYIGDKMTIVGTSDHAIEVDPPRALSVQHIPKKHFEGVWEVWIDYKAHKVKRIEITDITRFSKYIISIFHWYEEEVGHSHE